MIHENDKQYLAEFSAVAGDVLVSRADADVHQLLLFDACKQEAQRRGSEWMPMSTFFRLLSATGFEHRARRRRFLGIDVRYRYRPQRIPRD
ncbi:hypothetical protein [Streptomyces sp. NPDC017230]|uniref:hypothetical protein n=1 Tax=unclassified Streptomyces TaxID=2593676 RepID=UPI0037966220